MLSPDFLMELAKKIQAGLELTVQRLQDRAEAGGGEDSLSPMHILSGRAAEGGDLSDAFADAFARWLDEGRVSREDLASRLGCSIEDVNALGRRVPIRASRELVTALCLALELTPGEAEELFHSVGHDPLTDYEVYDIVIRHCLERGVFDWEDVNEALECFNLKRFSPPGLAAELRRRAESAS